MTKVRVVAEPTHVIVIEDNWAHTTVTSDLPYKWPGEAIFDDVLDEDVKEPVTTKEPVPMQRDGVNSTNREIDYWTMEGTMWTRHHIATMTWLSQLELISRRTEPIAPR